MKQVYTDASFTWQSTERTDEPVVRGKIAVAGEGLKIVEKVAVGKVPGLKQYINILELVAIARAIEIAHQRRWEPDLRVTTDSKVAMIWASSGKVSPKISTDAHVQALEYLARVKKEHGGIITFYFTPREKNPAGWLLSEELEREAPHTI